MTTKIDILPDLPARARDAHKGDFGHVLVVGGSVGLTGAPCMAARAAQRAGAGLVTVGLPASLNVVAEVKLTSAMSLPLPEAEEGALGEAAADHVLDLAARFDAVALGPGAGRAPGVVRAMLRLAERLPGPVVVDADGLNALSTRMEVLRLAQGPRILTPHPGEMARLLGFGGPGAVQADRVGTAVRFAAARGAVVVLKGAGTIVTDGERLFANPTGNPGMATGGTGDVLTGLVAGLLCQGLAPFEAALLATFAHGLAGDLAALRKGELSMTAEDVLELLPEAFQAVASVGRQARAADVVAAVRRT
jgi:NAD(P)H-hydrate epimerase